MKTKDTPLSHGADLGIAALNLLWDWREQRRDIERDALFEKCVAIRRARLEPEPEPEAEHKAAQSGDP